MKDKIIIKKELIPYIFDIPLPNEIFTLTVKYNEKIGVFTLDIENGTSVLVFGEPIIFGTPLFIDTFRQGFPPLKIVPYDESRNATDITYDNFNNTVFLCIFDEAGD